MRKRAFSLVEIMIVVMIIAILMAIAIPNLKIARQRSQQKSCIMNLKKIDEGKEIMAMQLNLANGTVVLGQDLWPNYIKGPAFPECAAGGTYTIEPIGTTPECSLGGNVEMPHKLDY